MALMLVDTSNFIERLRKASTVSISVDRLAEAGAANRGTIYRWERIGKGDPYRVAHSEQVLTQQIERAIADLQSLLPTPSGDENGKTE